MSLGELAALESKAKTVMREGRRPAQARVYQLRSRRHERRESAARSSEEHVVRARIQRLVASGGVRQRTRGVRQERIPRATILRNRAGPAPYRVRLAPGPIEGADVARPASARR